MLLFENAIERLEMICRWENITNINAKHFCSMVSPFLGPTIPE
jgi:hypothetical protein